MDQSFSYTFDKGPLQETIFLSGVIDAQAEAQCEALQKQINGSSITFDFSKVGRINSMGIALILRCLKRLNSDRNINVQLQGLGQMNAMLFKMSGIFLLAKETK